MDISINDLQAVGRHLLIRPEKDLVEEYSAGGIAMPAELLKKEREGVQIAEVLSVGENAFDDQPNVEVREGEYIVTERYSGQPIYLNPRENTAVIRVIMDTEVRCKVRAPDRPRAVSEVQA